MASRGVVDQRGRHQHAVARIALPANVVRRALLPHGIQQSLARYLPARLLRLRLRAAVDRRALGADVVLDAKALVGPPDSVPDWTLEGRGRQRDSRRARSEELHHAHHDRHADRSQLAESVHPARRREVGGVPLLWHGRRGRRANRGIGPELREGVQRGQHDRPQEHVARSAGPRPHVAAIRLASRIQQRADPEDARHRLLHVAGGDEDVQSPERAPRERGRELRRRRRVARGAGVSDRPAARGVGPDALASVPRRSHRHVHSAGVSVFVERRAVVAQPVCGRAHELDPRGGRPARHRGRRHPARRVQPAVDGAPRPGGGDGAFWRTGARFDPRDRRGNGTRRPRAGARHERQRGAHHLSNGNPVGRLQGVSRHGGRDRKGWRGGTGRRGWRAAEDHQHVAREQPSRGEDRRQRRHRVDRRQGRQARAAQSAGDARAARRCLARVAGVGSAVRHGAGARARVRVESDRESDRARTGACRARDHAHGRRLDLRAARAADRRRRPRGRRESRRLEVAELAAQSVVPAGGFESEGHV